MFLYDSLLILTISGRTVHTNAGTTIRRRGNVVGFDALRLQQTVEVEGTPRTSGSSSAIDAGKITIEEENLPEVEVKGSISERSPTTACPSISFRVSGRSVATNSATEFDRISCSALRNGDRVEVKAVQESNGTLHARRVWRD